MLKSCPATMRQANWKLRMCVNGMERHFNRINLVDSAFQVHSNVHNGMRHDCPTTSTTCMLFTCFCLSFASFALLLTLNSLHHTTESLGSKRNRKSVEIGAMSRRSLNEHQELCRTSFGHFLQLQYNLATKWSGVGLRFCTAQQTQTNRCAVASLQLHYSFAS